MRMKYPSKIAAGLPLLLFAATGFAEVKLPKVLSDHVVLQRDAPIHIWGWADPGEQVTVSLLSPKQTATARRSWQVERLPRPATRRRPLQHHVQGTNTITISDVLIGDVGSPPANRTWRCRSRAFPTRRF